ncbi:MAG: M56 family metallopeptidase, partial [Phycisphaerales bacterium]
MFLLETLFSQETITRLGWMLVHFLWQAGAVALLLAVLLRLLRRTAANLRYAIACGALALMVVLPVITMQLVEVPRPAAEAGPAFEIVQSMPVETVPLSVQKVDALPPLDLTPQTETPAMAIPWQDRVVTALEPALPYLVLGWLAGVFGLSAWHLGGWTQLHRLKRRMARQAGATLRATLDELATKLGVRRAVTLLESAIVEVPTVLGWLRPVILLPASALTGL